MPVSTILVQHRDGSPVRHVRVCLGFTWGMTPDAFTDDRGEAVVDHASTGDATIYVSGRKYHTFHAPGRTAVTVT